MKWLMRRHVCYSDPKCTSDKLKVHTCEITASNSCIVRKGKMSKTTRSIIHDAMTKHNHQALKPKLSILWTHENYNTRRAFFPL